MKVAIYGMGIIGREVFKTLFQKPKIEIVALCDTVLTGNLAYLLNHDSIPRLNQTTCSCRSAR